MRIKVSAIVFSLLLVITFFVPKLAYAATYTLSGHIQNSSGTAIDGATVEVKNPSTNAVVASTSTDSSGDYNFSIDEGTYNVQVTPASGSGFSSAIALNQNIASNTVLNFILVPSGSVKISGHLYDNLGNSLPNQQVILNLASGGEVASVTTDASGSYSFENSSNSYQLTVNGNNNNGALNVPETYSFNLPNRSYTQSTIQDITVPAKKVDIHVQDSSGNPVNGVVLKTTGGMVGQQNIQIGGGVTVFGLNAYLTNGRTTDSSGNATLWLFSGTNSYSIVANPPSGSGFSQTISNNTVSGNTNLTITLQQPVTISGTLSDALGNPLVNQNVTLNLSSGGEVGSVTTNASGNYSFQTSQGSYQLSISGNNNNGSLNVPETYSFNLPNASYTQNTVRDITVPAKKVDIHLQDPSGNPVNGAILKTSGGNVGQQNLPIGGGITVFGLNGYLSNGKTTNSSGNATLWLFPGTTNTYTIVATPPTGSNFIQGVFDNNSITADTNLTFTLQQPITISGNIYDILGNPLPNQQITLNLSSGGQVATTTTNSSGSYSFQTSTNSYNLAVSGNNNNGTLNVPESYSFNLPNTSYTQNTVRDITVSAKKLSIHVQDAFENPVSGVVLKTSGGNVGQQNLPIGGGITVFGLNGYLTNGRTTDSSGNTEIWLFPGTTNSYTVTATPPVDSIYSNFTLNNLSVTTDQNVVVSLQYSHNAPITSASITTEYEDQTYSNPATVTLSATADSGFSVANTYYTIDGGAQQAYTAPFTVSGNGNHTITYWSVDNSGVQEQVKTESFTIAARYSLTGTVYVDANQNGFQDSGEAGYNGATIELDFGPTTTTDSNGNYTFSNLVYGTYEAELTLPSGYTATTTNPVSVALNANTTQNFGIFSGPVRVTGINAGGNVSGEFVADTGYSGGSLYATTQTVSTTGVTNPAPQDVYKTVRYGNFTYTVSNLAPNSSYGVRLHFNELYWNSVGARVFDVKYNGQTVLDNYDIYEAAGGKNKAIVVEVNGTADSNGTVALQFVTEFNNAMVNGIEVYSGTFNVPSPTPTPTLSVPYGINTGGSTAGSYVADRNFSGGSLYTTTNSVNTTGVTNPAPEAVYKSVRYGNFTYTLPNLTPNTDYVLRLHFNELYWSNAGARVFDVSVNGTQVLNDYDIYQAASGANKAIVEEIPVTANASGNLVVQFSTVVNNAMVNGIEVVNE